MYVAVQGCGAPLVMGAQRGWALTVEARLCCQQPLYGFMSELSLQTQGKTACGAGLPFRG